MKNPVFRCVICHIWWLEKFSFYHWWLFIGQALILDATLIPESRRKTMPAGRPRLPADQGQEKVLISIDRTTLNYVEEVASAEGISRSAAFKTLVVVASSQIDYVEPLEPQRFETKSEVLNLEG